MNTRLIEDICGDESLCPFLAGRILELLPRYTILLLKGDLGSGKTTLSKEILNQAGYRQAVSSPTFNLVNVYQTEAGRIFYHFDLYRIRHAAELAEIGFTEYLDSGNPCLIEWPELVEQEVDLPHLLLEITHLENGRRYRLYTRD